MKIRRPRIPARIAHQIPRSARGSAVELTDGRWAAITPGDLLIASDSEVQFFPWMNYRAATWNGDDRILTMVGVNSHTDPLVLATASDDVFAFTTAARERVESSIVHHQSRELPDGMAQILIRRDAKGALHSQTVLVGPSSLATSHANQILALERSARRAAGMPD